MCIWKREPGRKSSSIYHEMEKRGCAFVALQQFAQVKGNDAAGHELVAWLLDTIMHAHVPMLLSDWSQVLWLDWCRSWCRE